MIEIQHKSFWPTGSRYICNPPVTTTDTDWVVLVDSLDKALQECKTKTWETNTEDYSDDEDKPATNWFSVKKKINQELINYIVTDDADNFNNWVTATELAKKLNLVKKEDRISLFEVIVKKAPMF